MKAFTLIEILVSVALFSVVMVIALGSLLAMSTADRKAESLSSVINNLNFALDSMSRSIRTGTGYHCGTTIGQDCSGGSSTFFFTSVANPLALTGYRFDTSGCPNGLGCIEVSKDAGATWTALTAPEVVLTNLGNVLFYVRGSQSGDTIQPIVTITLAGYVQVSPTQKSQFNLETSVTQRIYDQ